MSTPLTVTRIGHACQQMQIGGTRVLTDPRFTQTATYYHGEPVASTVADLGRIDAVVISHEHYGHCDLGRFQPRRTPDRSWHGRGHRMGQRVPRRPRHQGMGSHHDRRPHRDRDPGQHGVHEVTFVIEGGGRTVFFGGTRCAFRSWTPSRTGSAMSTWPSCRRTACASGR